MNQAQIRVLVAEDSPSLRALLTDVLAGEGYRVTEAGTAFEMQAAIAHSAEPQGKGGGFDLIVTDIRMPGKSGLDALAELRAGGSTSRFVVISAFPEDATERRIQELDARLLAKPFSLADFRSITRAALAAAAARGDA